MDALSTDALTSTEQYELHGHELVIERGRSSFIEVAVALLAIRDGRLYRATHPTFEAYCQDRWDMKRNYANKLIVAAEVIGNLGTNVPRLPANEAQARELAALPPEDQALVWQTLLNASPDGRITAGLVKSVATVFHEMRDTGAIDPGDGEMIAVSEIVKARATEETVERMERQKEHIVESLDKKAGGNGDGRALEVAKYELYTPAWLADRARLTLDGVIDLDPASCKEAQETVRAERYFDIDVDGLIQPWVSTSVFVNPPYSRAHNQLWAQKIVLEFTRGGAMKIIALLPAATGAPWFQLFADYPRCFLKQRVAFWGPADKGMGASFDSVVFALGVPLDTFAEAFEDVGHIYIHYTRGGNGHA